MAVIPKYLDSADLILPTDLREGDTKSIVWATPAIPDSRVTRNRRGRADGQTHSAWQSAIKALRLSLPNPLIAPSLPNSKREEEGAFSGVIQIESPSCRRSDRT